MTLIFHVVPFQSILYAKLLHLVKKNNELQNEPEATTLGDNTLNEPCIRFDPSDI